MKTTELDPLVSPDDADVIPIADVSESATKKLSIGDLKAAIGGGGGDASTWSQYPATASMRPPMKFGGKRSRGIAWISLACNGVCERSVRWGGSSGLSRGDALRFDVATY